MRTDQGVIPWLQAYVSFNMCDEFGVHGHQTYSYTYLLQNCNNGSFDISITDNVYIPINGLITEVLPYLYQNILTMYLV